VNLIIHTSQLLLLDRVFAVNATDLSIAFALIDRLFLISLNAHQALDFSTAYSLPTFSRMGSTKFSLALLANLFRPSISKCYHCC